MFERKGRERLDGLICQLCVRELFAGNGTTSRSPAHFTVPQSALLPSVCTISHFARCSVSEGTTTSRLCVFCVCVSTFMDTELTLMRCRWCWWWCGSWNRSLTLHALFTVGCTANCAAILSSGDVFEIASLSLSRPPFPLLNTRVACVHTFVPSQPPFRSLVTHTHSCVCVCVYVSRHQQPHFSSAVMRVTG